MADLICTRCAKAHPLPDSVRRREFTTATSFPRNTYASPDEVNASGEDLIFCPSCFLEDRDHALDDFSLHLKRDDERVNPDGRDRERADQGDADVVHTPPASRGGA